MYRFLITGIVVAAMATATATAQTLYIPASANAEGVNQTRWRTDLQIKAQGGVPSVVTIELLESRKNNLDPERREFGIQAWESLGLENLLETEFGHTGTGALRITATEGRVIATSRTYNDQPGGTYGQTVPSVGANDGFEFGDRSTLIQLSRSPDPSSGFRTNIGIVNLSNGRIDVVIDLLQASRLKYASLPYELKPFEHRQINDVFYEGGEDEVEDGYAVVRCTTEGGRYIAYASVVDNGSGDATFILGQNEVLEELPAERLVVFESFMRPG